MFSDADLTYVMGNFDPPDLPSEDALHSLGYLKRDISDIKTYYIRLGFHLDEFRRFGYYEDFGFSDLYEFCASNLGLDKSAVSRCINVWSNYCRVDGYTRTMFLDDRYSNYSYSQLCEMLSLTSDQRKRVLPDMTIKDIRDFKKSKSGSQQSGDSTVATSQPVKKTFDYDKYLDELFSWFMIHYKLTKNEDECPIAYEIFNSDIKQFTKTSVLEYLTNKLLSKDDNVNPKYIDADLNIFLRSYYNDNTKINPEDNLVCPLSRLKLLDKEKDAYKRIRPSYNSLSYLVVFYALEDLYEVESFDIDESMEAKNSPMKIFNLDKYLYLQYLDDMRKNGLITINKTAGLNTVYFERRLELEDIFNEYFGGRKNV